jgi:cyclopropane fatty-acyl-phospholipid synthase-like methyltransferase
MEDRKYLGIVAACETDLEKYGDTFLGVGWTKKKEYADTRYRVMLEVIKPDVSEKVSLLDFGCGASHLLEYILQRGLRNLEYSGLDLSEKFLDLSRRKFPHITYYNLDLLGDHDLLPDFDYVVLNGVFNYKGEISFDEMLEYSQNVISRAFSKARKGMAFNVMSKQVDWERDDLFHLPFDLLASFLTKKVSRDFVFRHDYGLYEYTAYVYR